MLMIPTSAPFDANSQFQELLGFATYWLVQNRIDPGHGIDDTSGTAPPPYALLQIRHSLPSSDEYAIILIGLRPPWVQDTLFWTTLLLRIAEMILQVGGCRRESPIGSE